MIMAGKGSRWGIAFIGAPSRGIPIAANAPLVAFARPGELAARLVAVFRPAVAENRRQGPRSRGAAGVGAADDAVVVRPRRSGRSGSPAPRLLKGILAASFCFRIVTVAR